MWDQNYRYNLEIRKALENNGFVNTGIMKTPITDLMNGIEISFKQIEFSRASKNGRQNSPKVHMAITIFFSPKKGWKYWNLSRIGSNM